MNYKEYIEKNTLRVEAGYRGGGIEIDLEEATGIDGAKMTAYQNYLGGGMLGSIQNSFNGDFEVDNELVEAVNRYFHELTNHEGDEWEETDYEGCQSRPGSAY